MFCDCYRSAFSLVNLSLKHLDAILDKFFENLLNLKVLIKLLNLIVDKFVKFIFNKFNKFNV